MNDARTARIAKLFLDAVWLDAALRRDDGSKVDAEELSPVDANLTDAELDRLERELYELAQGLAEHYRCCEY
jgi:hypothetical protein